MSTILGATANVDMPVTAVKAVGLLTLTSHFATANAA
jgi:hypothetical protein